MKKLIFTLLAACSLTSAKADEGMWTLYNLPNAVYETMKQENFQLPYNALYYGDDAVIAYKTGNDAVQALITNKVDCVVIDNEPAKAYVAQNSGLTILETEYVIEDYAICIAKNNTDLLNKVNDAIADLQADGTIKSILDKYIKA